MNYNVVWKHSVIRRLAEIYVQLRQRGEPTAPLTAAVARLDQLLQTDPHTCGKSRADTERILIVSPLAVSFEVYQDEHVVFVMRLRYAPGRPHPGN
jgi:hypothetical protein